MSWWQLQEGNGIDSLCPSPDVWSFVGLAVSACCMWDSNGGSPGRARSLRDSDGGSPRRARSLWDSVIGSPGRVRSPWDSNSGSPGRPRSLRASQQPPSLTIPGSLWSRSEYEKGVYLQSALANITANVAQYYAPITAPFVNTFLGGINTHAIPWSWQGQNFGDGSNDQTYPFLLTQWSQQQSPTPTAAATTSPTPTPTAPVPTPVPTTAPSGPITNTGTTKIASNAASATG
jgi:hypothetical protein